MLVRVFAIAHLLAAFQREMQAQRKKRGVDHAHSFAIVVRNGQPFERRGDLAVILRGAGESFSRQIEARRRAQLAAALDFCRDGSVIGGIGYDRHAFEILGGGTNHGGAADVDIFDQFFSGDAGLARGSRERIEIYHHHVDGGDAVIGDLLQILGQAAAVQDSPVDFGMQRFHPSAQHFRPAGDLRNVAHREPSIAQQTRGATGGDNFDGQSGQAFANSSKPVLSKTLNNARWIGTASISLVWPQV